jgi:hypothetical protein
MSYFEPYIKGHYIFERDVSFKVWFESKFTNVPPDILNYYEKLVDKITSIMSSLKKVNDHNVKTKIGEITVFGRNIPIYIGKTLGNRSHYDYENNRILIQYNDDLNTISDDLLHELGHATNPTYTSPKWSGVGSKYKLYPQTDAEKTAYVKEPVEFDAMGAHAAEIIKANFRVAKNDEHNNEKYKIVKNLIDWLKTNSDDFPWIDINVIKKWKTKPTLWKKFQSRIWNLTRDLKKELPANQQEMLP